MNIHYHYRTPNTSLLCHAPCAALLFAGCVSQSHGQTRLPAQTIAPSGNYFFEQTRRVCQRMQEEISFQPTPVSRLFMEGTLASDPAHTQSAQSLKNSSYVFHAAACAAYSTDPAVSSVAQKRAAEFFHAWTTTYVPQGNPINDNSLLPFFEAAFLLNSKLSQPERESLSIWLRKFIAQGDEFYSGKIEAGTRRISQNVNRDERKWNNWQTWRLAIRAFAARLLGDDRELEITRELITSVIEKNLYADGTGIDLKTRDALLYHVYNLMAWTKIALFVPEVLNEQQLARIEAAILYLKPFYEGKEKHIEFTNSTVLFDAKRRDAGQPEFQSVAWEPKHANELLRLSRCVFPKVKSWTAALEHSNEAAPRVKFLAAFFCDG